MSLNHPIDRARKHVEELRIALLTPSADEVIAALPGLDEAVRCLTAASEDRPARADLEKPKLLKLKNELRTVARLIEHGAALNQGWANLLGAAAAGYTPAGQPAPLAQLTGGESAVFIRG